MNNLKAFNLSIGTVVLRFYMMMGVVIVAGFSGYWLFGLLALPIFLSIMMGVSFTKKQEEVIVKNKLSNSSSLASAPKDDLSNVA